MQSFLKTLLFAIILLFSVTAHSETVKKFYESGALHFKYNYLNGKLQGQSKEYYETGEPKADHIYRSGKLIAKKKYRHNGDIQYELKYEDGIKYETEIYYYATGELFRQRTLENGKREGLEIDYYRSGQKKAERNYINGKKEGSAKGFHINGKVQGDWIFENGEPVYATIFYSTGDKWLIHDDFDDRGRLNGVSKEYDKEGNLMALRYYKTNDMVKRKRVNWWQSWFLWW